MLRAFLIGLSKAEWAQRMIGGWKFAWRAASRFVAGEQPEDALRVVADLNAKGILATLDHLGENTTRVEDAEQATQDAIEMLERIQALGLHSGLSIKLSQIGLLLQPGVCEQNLLRILAQARACENFVRIDMEDSSAVDRTLNLYWEARRRGYENVGVVLQSYLYRSDTDLQALVRASARVRLVKGAYREPASIAFPRKADVDASYDRLARTLLEHSAAWIRQSPEAAAPGGRFPPAAALATHDPQRIHMAQQAALEIGLPKEGLEFQMLYGIRRDLQVQLAAEGFPVRVYVPYGTHWYPYMMRRLAERPANLWFFLSNFFRK